jgi:TRAP-type C4-dicarboxylate transport system substrate-binding protein
MKIPSPFIAGCVILLTTVLSVSGCSKEESTVSSKKSVKVIELTLANQHPSEAPMNRVVNDAWARWIEKETGGRVRITVLPAETVAKAADIYDAAKYSTEANFYISPFVHVMNLNTYNDLPPDIQELLSGEKAHLFHEVHGYNFDKDDAEYRDQLNQQYATAGLPEIYTLPEEEKEKWLNAIAPVRESWIRKAESMGAPGRAILEDAIRLAKEFDESPYDHCEKTLCEWEAQGYGEVPAPGHD